MKDSPPLKDSNQISVGYITKAHGVRGEVTFIPHNPESKVIQQIDHLFVRLYQSRSARLYAIESTRPIDKGFLLRLKGIQDRTQAEAIRHSEVFLDPEQLPPLSESEFYYFELEGAEAFSTKGEKLGHVLRILDAPAHPLLVLSYKGREVMIPFIDVFVPVVSPKEKRVEIEVIQGLLEDFE